MFTISRNIYSPCVVGTKESLRQMRMSETVKRLCEMAEAGDNMAKQRLPIWTPSCAEFRNGKRTAANALKLTNRLMLDFDEKGHSAEILQRCMAMKSQGLWDVLLVEESARRGTHVLINMPSNMTTKEILRQFSHDIGFEADPALKDIARCIYVVPQDHVLYEDERMYEETQQPVYVGVRIGDAAKARKADKEREESDKKAESDPQKREERAAVAPVTEVSMQHLAIFRKAVEKANLNINTLDMPGTMHNNLLAILSVGISKFIPEEEMRSIVGTYMPNYAMSDNCAGLLRDFYTKYTNVNAPLSKTLREILAETAIEAGDEGRSMGGLNLPPLPQKLPPLIEHLLSKTPSVYHATVAQAVFPSLGAHLLNVRFPYIDNVHHEATLMNVLMASTGNGKSCITKPIDAIMADIRERDRNSTMREREWKLKMTNKTANQKGEERPRDIIIQEIDSDVTNAAFVMRMKEAQGRFLYANLNEIELFDGLKTNSRSISNFQIMCLAFDPDNSYGQTRASFNAVSERVTVRFNWNASTTVSKGRRYFKKVLIDGPVSRINFCTIPERPIGSPIPRFGTYDSEFQEKLRPYIERLNSAVGVIECQEAQDMVMRMLDEDRNIAIINNDRTYENLSFRANVIAFLKAMVLYVAHGCQWSQEIDEFARWSKRYDMEVKMHYFGHDIDVANTDSDLSARPRKGASLLSQLPEVFGLDVLEQICKTNNSTTAPSQLLAVWKNRGLIDKTDRLNEWRKRG